MLAQREFLLDAQPRFVPSAVSALRETLVQIEPGAIPWTAMLWTESSARKASA